MFLKAGGSALALALVLGCAANTAKTSPDVGAQPASAPTIASVAGKYALVTVDGHALPYASKALGPSATPVVSGSLVVDANGTFQLQTAYSASASTGAPATGTCYPEGNEMKMVWDGGGLTGLTVRGDTVLIKREGAVYGYLRTR